MCGMLHAWYIAWCVLPLFVFHWISMHLIQLFIITLLKCFITLYSIFYLLFLFDIIASVFLCYLLKTRNHSLHKALCFYFFNYYLVVQRSKMEYS